MKCNCIDLRNEATKSLLCWECRRKKYHREYYLFKTKKLTKQDYLDEFLKVTNLHLKCLTTKGFDEETKISSMSIVKGLSTNWKTLLEEHDMITSLFKYVVEEYLKRAYERGKANSTAFIKEHPYIGQYMFSEIIDIRLVRKAGGFVNDFYDGQYNDYLLKKHFQEVMNSLGKIPSVSEFLKNGKILPSIYCDYYGIKGQLWDEVLKLMIDDKEELNNYFFSREKEYKEKAIGALKKYKDETLIPFTQLEQEFRRVFDYYIDKYGTHPTRRMFIKESIYNEITYRKRFEMRWSEIIQMYGYEIKERNISEKVFLEIIKQITRCNYERGKPWDWLIGVKGKNLYCDGYFKELNLAVEFDGKHHRTPVPNFGGYKRFQRDRQNDIIKENLVKERGYKFLRVSTKDNWESIEYLKKRLNEIGININ